MLPRTDLPVGEAEVERVVRRSRGYRDRHTFTTIVDDTMARRITQICLEEDLSRAEALRQIITRGLETWYEHQGENDGRNANNNPVPELALQ